MEWVNAELLPEHIVVRSLEEDMFDGLILHHLFRKWQSPPTCSLQVGFSPNLIPSVAQLWTTVLTLFPLNLGLPTSTLPRKHLCSACCW